MFLDVLAVVGYTARSNAGLSHQLKTDLPAQIIWDLPLLHNSQSNWCLLYSHTDQCQMFEMISPYLPLLIHFREKLVHVHQIFILQEQHRKWHHFIKHRDACVFRCVSHVFGSALVDLVSVLAVLWLLDSVVQLSETQAQRRTDVTSVHWSIRMTADVSVTSLSRPGWVWRDKRAAGFLGWFVSLLCCSSVSSWPCEEHLGYRLRNSTAVPSPGYKLKIISKSEFITWQLSDVEIISMTGMHRWCTLLEFYYKTGLLTPNITENRKLLLILVLQKVILIICWFAAQSLLVVSY